MQGPRYSAADIKKLAMPDIAGVDGAWTSTWTLTLARPFTPASLASLAEEVSLACVAEVSIDGDGPVRIVLHSRDHPLDVDGFMLVDCVLHAVHDALGIDQINGWPRDDWRTFRRR